MAMKLKINENFKSRRKWRSEDVSKKWRIRLNYVFSFYKRPRKKNCFSVENCWWRRMLWCFFFFFFKDESSCKFSNKQIWLCLDLFTIRFVKCKQLWKCEICYLYHRSGLSNFKPYLKLSRTNSPPLMWSPSVFSITFAFLKSFF